MQAGHGGIISQQVWKRWVSSNAIQINAYGKEMVADKIVDELRKKFDITDEGETIEEYLGIKIDHTQDRSFRMYQPLLIKRIIKGISGMNRSNEHKTPADSTPVLTIDSNGEKRRENWNYKSIIGMMNFLVNSTHPELSHA
eukprot:15129308-Ditylum_brightwellii.AAC.1